MSTLDIILLIIIAISAFSGFKFGFVHTFGSLVGLILGVFIASRFYPYVGSWFASLTGWGENTTRVLAFIVLFSLISRIIGLLFMLLEKFTYIITGLPIIKTLNRLLGLILGLFESILSIGLTIYFIERVPLTENIMNMLSNSLIAPLTTKVASILLPLLPDAIKMLDSTLEYL
jgi:uncharacterized membrane protein required for colicin V production